jgi:uncharacterized protein YPO0396
VALRDESSYTVLLAWFHNAGFDQGATLAQVFWLREGQRNPERFFVYAEAPLGIASHFSGFGADILELKRRLRRLAGVEVLDQFGDYATRFRHRFGIQPAQALDLFYQTVSMKSVGNLTDFVRNHMLERCDVDARIEGLCRAFDNLNRAHEAVLKAKAQIARLAPLVQDGERHAGLLADLAGLTACREALEAWFAGHRARLNEVLIGQLEAELAALRRRLQRLAQESAELAVKADSLKAGIEDQGGSRLRAIDQDLHRLEPERERRARARERYLNLSRALGLPAAEDEEAFHANRGRAETRLADLETRAAALTERRTDLLVALRQRKDQGTELEQELQSLHGRRSNLPRQSLEIRGQLARDLGIDEEALPFAGELLRVDEQELAWEGAIERLLHGFGLSLLVPEEHYAAVSRYVDRTRLAGRLVYFRTRAEATRPGVREVDPRALCRKLRIRPESPFYAWLEGWLAESFDHLCCQDLEEFRRQPRAITAQGQIKTGGRRHEKDDRHDLHDRSRYVLGWSNEDKIRALEARLDELSADIVRLAREAEDLGREVHSLGRQRDHARDLLNVEPFASLDWPAVAREIAALMEEKRSIENSSDALKDLRTQLRIVEGAIALKQERQQETRREEGRLETRLEGARAQLQEALGLAGAASHPEEVARALDALHATALAGEAPALANLEHQQRALREHIQAAIDRQAKQRDRLRDALIRAMQEYRHDYPADTTEVDASIEALPDYAAMLQELQTEGLPRHEARFREMLRQDTIRGVAMFQSQLEREQREIGVKIEAINRSLRAIEYNPGTYITLVRDPSPDIEIRDFRQELRQVLSGALDEGELYSEEKFLQVKTLIMRFNGREGLVELDRRWTRKVTDVRNWFRFSASERHLADDSEREFYSDTAGKSGGQKEKLAYTILASALAYQFGLEWGGVRSRSFRFVVIDEAFGRGSDESTRYALELFRRLNLQLLIVTPLQKIHIIEDYISAVHYVSNAGGHDSVVRNLSVQEYRAEKARALAGAPAAALPA